MEVELLAQHVTELDEAAFAQFRTWFAEFEQTSRQNIDLELAKEL